MQLHAVALASADLAQITARGAKTDRLAGLLAATETVAETVVVVSWLSGELPQRQIGVGGAALRELPSAATEPSLTVLGVDAQLTEIGGTAGLGSQARRRDLLAELFGAATELEQQFLRRLLTGELRQGALAGVMSDAVARAAGRPLTEVRRAAMVSGDLAVVAGAALHGDPDALAQFRLEVGRGVGPMLAQTAASTDDALATLGGTAAFEWKLDGVRVQLHRSGADIRIFTRTLDDVTARLPEVVAAVRALPVSSLVADGEVIALGPADRPRPFQVTSSRLGTRRSTGPDSTPLTVFLFDLLHLDGVDLLDESAEARAQALAALAPATGEIRSTPRVVTTDPAVAAEFLAEALQLGHEGVIVKSLTAGYAAGRRGAGWLKVKPVHTLDLVVLAVEWGSGRRAGTLSNIHLGARDESADGSGFVMLGKTFKGMTDEMLQWQTRRFTELAVGPTEGWVVPVRPEQVVEIAFDGVQTSSRYPGGVALRFARVLRYRDDKTAAEVDTITTVRSFRGG